MKRRSLMFPELEGYVAVYLNGEGCQVGIEESQKESHIIGDRKRTTYT